MAAQEVNQGCTRDVLELLHLHHSLRIVYSRWHPERDENNPHLGPDKKRYPQDDPAEAFENKAAHIPVLNCYEMIQLLTKFYKIKCKLLQNEEKNGRIKRSLKRLVNVNYGRSGDGNSTPEAKSPERVTPLLKENGRTSFPLEFSGSESRNEFPPKIALLVFPKEQDPIDVTLIWYSFRHTRKGRGFRPNPIDLTKEENDRQIEDEQTEVARSIVAGTGGSKEDSRTPLAR
ncbi:hypothetical protein RUM44_001297 [Polyplax serrata]|uniref:Uncharacterized protein n=1 Tax=Polyplax serrata TaxID=468196 RepID=A0ABR1AJL7_POLSC